MGKCSLIKRGSESEKKEIMVRCKALVWKCEMKELSRISE